LSIVLGILVFLYEQYDILVLNVLVSAPPKKRHAPAPHQFLGWPRCISSLITEECTQIFLIWICPQTSISHIRNWANQILSCTRFL